MWSKQDLNRFSYGTPFVLPPKPDAHRRAGLTQSPLVPSRQSRLLSLWRGLLFDLKHVWRMGVFHPQHQHQQVISRRAFGEAVVWETEPMYHTEGPDVSGFHIPRLGKKRHRAQTAQTLGSLNRSIRSHRARSGVWSPL